MVNWALNGGQGVDRGALSNGQLDQLAHLQSNAVWGAPRAGPLEGGARGPLLASVSS